MRNLIPALVLLLALPAFADTTTLRIKGMHCGECAKSVEEAACKMDGVASCKAKVTNAKKKTGELTITMDEGKTLDTMEVEKLVSASGEFHVMKSSKK